MKKTFSLLSIVVLVSVTLTACKTSSLNATVYNSENLAADAATAAVEDFDTFVASNTNGMSAAAIVKLVETQTEVHSAAHTFANDLDVVTRLRRAYVVNSADTNKTAMLAALQTVSDESSNIVLVVAPFIPKK